MGSLERELKIAVRTSLVQRGNELYFTIIVPADAPIECRELLGEEMLDIPRINVFDLRFY
jgi:hypothetical protein